MPEVSIEDLYKRYDEAVANDDLAAKDMSLAYIARYHGYERTGGQEQDALMLEGKDTNRSEGADIKPPVDPVTQGLELGMEEHHAQQAMKPEEPEDIDYLEAKSIATGFTEGAPVFPGMVLGAKLGAAGGIPGVVVGGATGAVVGFLAGDYINELVANNIGITLSDSDVANLEGDDIEKYYAFSMLGSVVSGSLATSLTAKTGVKFGVDKLAKASKLSKYSAATSNFVGSKTNQLMTFAAQHPIKQIGLETLTVPGTFFTGKFVEDLGGNRFVGELIGNVVNPLHLIGKGIQWSATNTWSGLQRIVSKKGTQDSAMQQIATIMNKNDVDFETIKKILQDPDIVGVVDHDGAKNVGLLTGNPTLIAISKDLEKFSENFGEANKKMISDTDEALKLMIKELYMSGDPRELVLAADLQVQRVSRLMDADVMMAESNALVSAGELMDKGLQSDPKAMMKESLKNKEIFHKVAKRGREVIDAYWDAIEHVPITKENVKSVLSAYDEVQKELGPEAFEELISKGTKQFFKNISKELRIKPSINEGDVFDIPDSWIESLDPSNLKEPVTTQRLTKFYSFMMSKHREAVIAGNDVASRQYKKLAEAALADVDASGITGDAHQMAREVTKNFHDTMSRSLLGVTDKKNRFGYAQSPEQLIQKVFSYGDEATEIALQDIEDVTKFMDRYAVPEVMGNAGELIEETAQEMIVMKASHERMFKIMASQTVDSKNVGTAANPKVIETVNPMKAEKFIKDNPVLMQRFPEVKEALTSAMDSELGRLQMVARAKEETIHQTKKSVYASVLKKEPVAEVKRAMRSTRPFKALGDMVKVAKGADESEAAIMGLKSSILEAALLHASSGEGKFNHKVFKNLLFGSHGKEGESITGFMLKEGIFSNDDLKRITFIVDTADNLDLYKNPGVAIDRIETESDYIIQQLIGGVGATMGPKVAKGLFGQDAGGHALLLASRSSGAAVRLFDSLPRHKSTDFMIELMSNPDLFVDVMGKELKKGKFVKVADRLTYRKGHSALYRGGFLTGEEQEQEASQ